MSYLVLRDIYLGNLLGFGIIWGNLKASVKYRQLQNINAEFKSNSVM